MKVAVIYGGKSTEHNISVESATSVISNLKKDKYEIYPIYIDNNGEFYQYKGVFDKEKLDTKLVKINNVLNYLKDMDVIFPVLHGLYGEDGTIQGLLDLINKKYVGCHTFSSALCMDKVYTKIILDNAKIIQAKSIYLKKLNGEILYIDNSFNRKVVNYDKVNELIIQKLHYPVFIKPSKSGSSVGVSKVNNKEELIIGLEQAFHFDAKVLIEETINGREVECAVLGNDDLIISTVGEITYNDQFYSYEAKYQDKNSKTIIPANISNEIKKKIQLIAKKAFLTCDCQGLSRIDFFIEKDTNKIILNEINTMPGFTEISMYPKLMAYSGLSYPDLLDKLIDLANY